MHQTNFLSDINKEAERNNKPPILPVIARGRSRKFFNRDGVPPHMWLGLLQKGADESQMIAVDPSFQEISLLGNNGYRLGPFLRDPAEMPNLETVAKIPVGSMVKAEIGGEKFTSVETPYHPVLGISSDRSLVYNLSFALNSSTQR